MALQLFDDALFDPVIFDTHGQTGLTATATRRKRKYGRTDYGRHKLPTKE